MTIDDETLDGLITVRDWLRFAASRFGEAELVYGHGTASALDEAAFLILSVLHLAHDQLEPWLDARLTMPERRAIAEIIARRIETRKPAPYLVGAAYIQGRRFHVDERVIVPRSYLGELLCQGGLAPVLPDQIEHVLDLCTGSGCLAILAALTFPDAKVDATDISPGALEVAARNVKTYDLADRIRLEAGDLLDAIGDATYDVILANPPYVAQPEVAAFAPEYAAEPLLAHAGGDDGLDLVRRILARAARHLPPDGVLVVEIGTGRSALEAEFPALPFVWLDTETSEGEVLALRRSDLEYEIVPLPQAGRG